MNNARAYHFRILAFLFLMVQYSTHLNADRFNFAKLDALMGQAIQENTFPGAVVLINFQGETVYHKAFSHHTYDSKSPHVKLDTIFDLASLTKVIATTTLAMLLHEGQKLSLDDAVSQYLSGFESDERRAIRIKHLLTHTSGIKENMNYSVTASAEDLWRETLAYPQEAPPGTKYRYSCSNMIILQRIIERLTGVSLQEAVRKYITEPLGMYNTFFNPPDKNRCAPTMSASWRGAVQGVVHDPRSFIFDGIAGNAGLFSTAADLEKFMLMLFNNGLYCSDGVCHQFIKPQTSDAWTSPQCAFNRGYGWEIGRHLSSDAFGHFGWTGTSIWADKKLKLFCILLANRTYPDDHNFNIREFRGVFHNLIMEIVTESMTI
jgi:serine-type D-Ala-D-Ala carboxypeptidase